MESAPYVGGMNLVHCFFRSMKLPRFFFSPVVAPRNWLALGAVLIAIGCLTASADTPVKLPVMGVTESGDDGNVASNAVDGSLGTRWSASGDGQWIRLDLGTATNVGVVKIAWHKGDQRRAIFDLQTSGDGSSWATVFSGESSGTTTNFESFPTTNATGRYLRILGHGNSADMWNSVLEAQAYSAAAIPPGLHLHLGLTNAASPGGSIALQWNATPGEYYQIQTSSNMVTWEDSGVIITNTDTTQTWVDPIPQTSDATVSAKYYRVKKVKPPTNTGTNVNLTLPSVVLDLTNWKLTLPVDTSHAGSPDEYLQPELATFVDTNYFYANATTDGIVFTAPCGGATTSGSGYPRSELREMTNNGTALATWSTTSGIHTMEITEAITHLPNVKPQVVAGQIHDPNDDVITFRLEGSKLFIDQNGANGPTLTTNYNLGDIFTAKWVAHDGGVDCYYNGQFIYTYPVSDSGCYFKAGCYTQSNTNKGDLPTAYGQVVVYAVNITHQPDSTQNPPPPVTNNLVLPATVLDLTNWKLTLPVDTAHAGSPDEYLQPELATFVDTNYFYVNADTNAVVFTAPCGGATTSGSGYPRSELREMTNNGAALASWSTTSGTHTMEITEAITHLPDVKPHCVAGQIHDPNDDVITFRLEGTKLFIDQNGVNGPTLNSNYQLGDIFTVKWVAHDGGVDCYYNGQFIYTYQVSDSGCYFKIGCYTQSNTSKGDLPTAYGQVMVYSYSVSHQ